MNQMYFVLAASVSALVMSCSKPEAPQYNPRPLVVSPPPAPTEPNYCVKLANALSDKQKNGNGIRHEWVTGTGSLYLVGRGDCCGSIENPALATSPQIEECRSRLESITNSTTSSTNIMLGPQPQKRAK